MSFKFGSKKIVVLASLNFLREVKATTVLNIQVVEKRTNATLTVELVIELVRDQLTTFLAR